MLRLDIAASEQVGHSAISEINMLIVIRTLTENKSKELIAQLISCAQQITTFTRSMTYIVSSGALNSTHSLTL